MFYKNIVINNVIAYKQLILVFLLHLSAALAQIITGITTATTMAVAAGNGPLAPHMRPCAWRRCFKWMDANPLSLRMYFLRGVRVLCPWK